ncbi:MAG: GGDEF domain-containing protein [Ignavibacteriae bacterium]|nr:GGDEF domain-containing protein [Ignavibacteriota bacterium]MCB9216166.1 GGDEF domain-containing protein [Ignavibacteria bacterium]
MKVLENSIPNVIGGLVVVITIAIFPPIRSGIWALLITDVTIASGFLLLSIILSIGIGGAFMYSLLKQKIEAGKIDVMTESLRAEQINPFLEKRLKDAKAKGTSFAVLLVDIDSFKTINDDYDHEIGNHTLSELVQVIHPRSKGEEIFRYGGDEFLIITGLGVAKRECWGYAKRIVREVAEYDFPGKINSNKHVKLTVSCGCVVSRGEETVDLIREYVVNALKNAKKPNEESPNGKNSAYLYEQSTEQSTITTGTS